MSTFAKVRPLGVALLFTLCLASWLLWQPLFAAENRQSTTTEPTTYVIQSGDTLSSIARRFDTTVSTLLRLNNLANPDYIYPGQTLILREATAEATPTPGSTVPDATASPTPTAAITATATVTPTAEATPEVTPEVTTTVTTTVPVTVTPVATTTGTVTDVVWTAPEQPIELFSPVGEGLYHSPLEVIGFSQTFEGNVNLRLSDAEGNILAERSTIGGSVDGFAFFHSYLRFTVTEPVTGTLAVFETSARNGSEINVVTIPLKLLPGQRVIDLTNLTPGKAVCSPIIAAGYSNTFEASLVVELADRAGAVMGQSNAMGGNLGVYAEFLTTLEPDVTTAQPVLVGAYEEAASGEGLVDRTRYPVTLYPAGSTECP
ncbi:MAG: LysM peptidoglycan-binding domain-containing protein [Caldilineaceae bacterium]|nr:LysM peptidoglycan-binding domain-containing protein [Caldilineaceae bacterium]